MKRFVTGFALLAVACSGDKDSKKSNECEVAACSFAWDCSVGYTCGDTGCCEPFGCTPTSCGVGQFCDEDFACKSIADKCALSDCECHIVNAAGELQADASVDPRLATASGGTLKLQAVLAVTGGNPLPGASFTFAAASAPAGNATNFAALFDLSGNNLTAKSGAGGTAVVEAKLGQDVSCVAQVTNLGSAPANVVRVYAFDDATGLPVPGVQVVLDYGGDGGADETVTTSAAGTAQGGQTVATAYSVSVFKAGYNYLSVVGLDASTRDLALPMSARPVAKTTGGFTGRVDFASYEKYVLGREKTYRLAIVGSSFSLKSILNFEIEKILGTFDMSVDCDAVPTPAGCYNIPLAPLFEGFAPLPGGLVFTLKGREVKPFFDSVGPGGRRFAWSLGGEIEINDVQGLVNTLTGALNCSCDATPDVCDATCACDGDCGSTINFGDIINGIVPLFASFGSGVQGNLPLKEVPLGDWQSYIQVPYADRFDPQSRFPRLDDGGYGKLSMREPMRRFTALTIPALPADPDNAGASLEGVLVLSGVNTVGQGFVPLGLGFATDCTEGNCLDRVNNAAGFDGHINGAVICPNPDTCPPGVPLQVGRDVLGLFHAGAHGGLQDQEFLTVLAAIPVSALSGDVGGLRATAIVLRGEPASGTQDVSSKSYPTIPTVPATTAPRTYTAASAGSDIDLHWVTVASSSTRWNIYFPGAGGTFHAPAVPSGFDDPFVPNTDGELDVTHSGFQLPSSVSLSSAVSNNGTTLADLPGQLDGFSARNRMVLVQ